MPCIPKASLLPPWTLPGPRHCPQVRGPTPPSRDPRADFARPSSPARMAASSRDAFSPLRAVPMFPLGSTHSCREQPCGRLIPWELRLGWSRCGLRVYVRGLRGPQIAHMWHHLRNDESGSLVRFPESGFDFHVGGARGHISPSGGIARPLAAVRNLRLEALEGRTHPRSQHRLSWVYLFVP